MIGFGPTGISFANSEQGAVKVINPDSASDYLLAVGRGRPAWDRAFVYGPKDLRVFHLIRRLAALRIERGDYQAFFGSDPVADFPRQFEVLETEGLLSVTDDAIEPTAIGMFYADSIAGLLSWELFRTKRNGPKLNAVVGNDNGHGHM